MNHNIITTSSMIQNRKSQHTQTTNLQSASERNSIVRTLQMLLTALTMLFAVGVQGAWAEVQTIFDAADTGWTAQGVSLTSGTTTVGDVTWYSGSSAAYAVGAKTFSDDVQWNGRLKFGGKSTFKSGSTLACVIKFTVASAGTVKVYCVGGGSGTRTTYISQSLTPTDRDPSTAKGSFASENQATGIATAEVIAGDVYVWADNNVGVYGITFEASNEGEKIVSSEIPTGVSINGTAVAGATFTNNTYTYTGGSFVIDPKVSIPTLITYTDGTTKQSSATATVAINQANDTFVATATIRGVVYTVNIPASEISTTLSDVSEATTWDWTKTGISEIQLTDATRIRKSSEFILSNLIADNSEFNSDALKVMAEYPVRGGKYMQGNKVIFHTTVPGNIVVKFSNTGTRTAGQERYLVVNGVQTSFGSIAATENDITTDEIAVPAGDVVLTAKLNGDDASQMIRVYSIVFTATSTPAPTPTVIPFSMAEEATTATEHYPTEEWGAGHEVQLPVLPEFTESNTIYINAAPYNASTESNDNTEAIQKALNAVPDEGGMVVVPAGTWLSGPLTVKSKTVLHLKDGAVLKLLPFAGVNVVPTAGSGKYPVNNSETQNKFTYKMFLTCADNATDIVVEGEGDGSIIEGQGGDWWPNRDNMGTRPPLIRFQKGSRFLFRNFKLQNAPGTNLALSNSNGASDFTVHNVTIKNPSSIQSEATADGYTAVSHNTDGIPVWGARVNIYDCLIDTGDDNIVFDSDSQYGHVWNCTFGRGHGASFGSYTERLHHIIYEGITFNGTSAGFRIKTQRGRSGNETSSVDKNGAEKGLNGSVHDIICRNATMTNVTEPIVLTTHYDQEVDDPEHFESAAVTYQTPEYKDFLFKDITVNSIGNCYSGFNRQRPIYIYGLPEMYIHDITFDNVKITGANTAYLAYCRDIHFTNGTTITNTAKPTSVVGTKYEASWTGSLLPSDLAISDGKGTVAMTVGDTDKALVKGTDYTTSSEGVITLSSNNEEVVTIVDGKIHAVGAGTAKVTISQAELAANGIYGAGEKEVTVNVTAAPAIMTIYSWESSGSESTDIAETGGKIEHKYGADNRLNYQNGGYYTVCLNGKKSDITSTTASNNASRMVITFDEALKANDNIAFTCFYNKNAETSVSIWLAFEKGAGIASDKLSSAANIHSDFGGQPEVINVKVPADADGSKTLTLTRSDAGTNLFITKIEIKGERAALAASDLAVADGKGTIDMTVGDADKALAKDVDYTTSSTGAVTLSSSDTSVATIVDGKIHAVAAGTATITISQAADAIFEAATAEVSLTVAAGAGPSYPLTAKWDFQHGIPSTITSVNINGTTGTVASDQAGIELAVDATTGKLTSRESDAQYNSGAIIRVPVTSKYDEVTIVSYPGYHHYTINGIAASADSETIKAGDEGIEKGYVEIISTNTAYLYSISVTQQGPDYVPAENWDPTWDEANNRWVVKNGATDIENAKGLTEALKFINTASNVAGKNKVLYIPNGTYDLGTKAQTAVPAGATLTGESMEGVVIKNAPEYEGIGITATLQIDGNDVTLENLTLYCRAPYGTTLKDGNPTSSNAERGVCLVDRGTNNVFRHITLDGLQDTYYSWKSNAANTSYFYDCVLKGSVDFLCGSGNVWFENCTLGVVPGHSDNNGTLSKNAPYIIAPNADNPEFGYIFNNCTIVNGSSVNMDGNYYLGRPWNAHPKASFINTTMNILPKAEGFSIESAGTGSYVASEWTEIGSVDGLGNPVNTNSRMTDVTVISKTKPEAKKLPAPVITKSGSKITWTAVDGAIAYNVYKNGVFQAMIDVPTTSAAKGMLRAAAAGALEYDITGAEDAVWTVRAINALRVIGLAQNEQPEAEDPYADIPFTDEALVINNTNKPFAYATATDRANPESVKAENITGGGEYDLETIMEKMEANGGYTPGTTKTITTSNGDKKAIVLKSANTTENGKEKRNAMDQTIIDAINNNDIIVLDGAGYSDFVVKSVMTFRKVANKTVVGINGARLCTEWYLTDYFKSILENVPTSSGTGVNSASTAEGTGGDLYDKDGKFIEHIKEEGEFLTRKNLYAAVGNEDYRYSGIFYLGACKNWIIRNLKLVGPGSLDCAGYDLMAIIDSDNGTMFSDHMWVDHCEFIDGMDGNFDITNGSDFVTVSWCKFYYTDRSYAHQNTNLVGSSDDKKAMDGGKLNITFAYNEWGANCRARMPMARYGRIHMLNNYYNCPGNSEYAMNPRIESEFLVEGNYWERGVRRTFTQKGANAITWDSNNYYADNAAGEKGSSFGTTVTVPYQYSSIMLDPHKVPEVITLNGGAKLYQKPYFTTNLGVVDTDKTAPYEYTAVLSECEADGLVFSVWAENAHTFQWYKQDIALGGTAGEWEMLEGENRNTYTYMPKTGVTFNIKCKAFGVSGETESDVLKVTIDGESKPIYITDLDDTKTVEVISGSPQIFTVNAGTNNVTYQWYKSANADGSSATAIDGATDRSYTYSSTATTGEVVYLFCRATNQQGSTDSKIVKVKGIYRNVKFHMYATYDANAKESSVFVEGGTHNINKVGTKDANITADSDGCKAEVNRTKDISGLRFENAENSTHTNPLGISAHFVPTTAIANGDKIEVSINTSSTSSANTNYGFYVCKAAEIGTENANVIGTITVNGNALKTQTFTATEDITDLYLIPFVGGAAKNINLANVVVYSGEEVKPVDDPVFITDLAEEYKVKVGQRQTLSVEVDENDVQSYQWYKNTTKTTDGATSIDGATSASYEYTAAAEGTEYLYCVVTGKKPDTSITSTIATVVATAANDKDPIIWIFDDYCKEHSIAAGSSADLARSTTTVVSTCNGQELKYVTANNSESRVYNLSNTPVTVDEVEYNSYLYMGGSGKVNDRAYVTPALSGSGTLTVIYHSTSSTPGTLKIYDNAKTNADPLATATPVANQAVEIKLKNLNDTELQLVHDQKSGVLGIIWTPNQSIVMEKGIYSTSFSNWTAKNKDANGFDVAVKTKDNQDLTFKLVSTSVAPEGTYDAKFKAEGKGYLKTEADNAYIQTTKLNNVTKVYYRLGSTGSNRGFILSKSTDNGANWTQVGSDMDQAKECTHEINEENVMLKWAYTSATGKNAFMLDLVIYGMMELTNCEEPTYEEAWSGDENEKWVYDFTSTTETANLKYTIDDGAEQTIEAATGRISVNPGQKISIWAVDSEETLPNSPVVEVTAPAKKATATPNLKVEVYNVANHNYPVKIEGADEGASVYYTIDGSEPTASSTLYTGPFTVGQEVTVKAIAIRPHYADSPVLTYTTVAINLPQIETFKTTGPGSADAEAKGIKNILNPAEIDGKYISGIDGKTGLKYTINGATDQVDADGTTKINGIQIDVHEGYVITALNFADTYCNTSNKNIKLSRVFVDGVAIPGFEAKTIPNSPKSNFKIEGIAATESIVLEIIPDADVNQARAAISPVYEFVETPVSATVDGVAFTEEQNNALKNDHVVTIDNKLFAENPVIVVTTDKGYEYTLKEDPSGLEGDYTRFFKKFVGQDYIVKVKVNAMKSPYITIGEELSLAGGYKVTLTGIDYTKTTPYINIDGKTDGNGDLVWEEYDKDKSYYALKEVNTRSGYSDDQTQTVLYTDPRKASCPDNSYEAGKPFAVYLYVNGYSDNQVGTHAYNNESFKTDKIYQAVANQFNVIPLAVDNSKEILSYRSDITDAKLVVITETLGGSGSVEIAGVGNKSNMMALTLKRDVLDKTNVLNLKMFLNGSSSANNQRWQWAQPRAMTSEITSIMPCTPDGGGMYEIFGNATMSRDASINLWDDISTENMLYHLQPVFNFNEENASLPNFTPLALVIDPEEPEDQREGYHAIHFYKENGFQYVGFGLSINEWTQYNNNVYAIIDKIGEMIKDGRSLDSKLTGIVKPTITDNGDGSANVFNNNPNADTYYKVYTQSEYEALNGTVPAAADLISGGTKANDNDFHTEKFTEKRYIFAVSKLGIEAVSEVVEGTVEGNSIRYVIRENDDPAAQGMVAKYPFDLTVNSGTFTMPYNQSWKKDGYTVKEWEVTKSSDVSYPIGTKIKPDDEVSGLTQDITVKAIWSENTFKVTDLSKTEDKTARTVTWEFLQSKGAPALSMESKAGNMQAILVGQAKFRRDKEHPTTVTDWIDVPMTINTDNLATLPDNNTEYHGKFNNTSVNWAAELTDGLDHYTGSDYAQVRTGTQFTFPAVYGMNVVYKQVDLVEAVNGEANGNVNRSQVSQSFLTDGTKAADALKNWSFVNPGFQLDANGKVVMVDGVAQLAKTSLMYAAYGEKGRELGLYDEVNGGNHANGGLIYYTGDGTEATFTSVESAQYIHVGAATGKKLGALNYGSVFMQSLSVVYPELYDLKYTVVAVGNTDPENTTKSEYDPNDELAKVELFSNTHKNAGGRYFLGDKVKMKFTPAYGYEVLREDNAAADQVEPAVLEYYFIKNSDAAFAQDGMTVQRYLSLDADGRKANDAKAIDAEDRIPADGAIVNFKMTDLNLTFSVKKLPAVKYKVEAYPSTLGYITFNSGNGRPHKDEYKEFPVGKTIYVTAHPNTGYKFKEWRRNTGTGEILVSQAEYDALDSQDGYMVIPTGVTKGDGDMQNPFDPTDFLEKDEMMFTVSEDNNDFTYVAVFEEGKTGTAHYEFEHALLQTSKNQDHKEMTKLEITADDRNQFPPQASSKALNIPYYYTLFKPGYTLDHWVEIEEEHETNEKAHTPADHVYGKSYRIGTFYYYATEGEVKHLVPVFTKNTTSYDYRATPVDITWDFRVAENAQRMTFKSGTNGNTAADTKIYYSTHAKINNGVLIDVPLTITLGKKGKLVNDIEEEDKWCAMGEGTTIVIPSGLGAKFTIASLSKMETTTIDGVVPTSYTVEKIDDADVYLYTFTTTSESTSVTLKIGDDYTYYKYIRAELPAADAVPLTVTVNNDAFGTVEIAKVRTTADAVDSNNTELLAKINATKTPIQSRALNSGHQYTLGLGTIVSLHAKRSHLYVLDYFEDGDGHRYYYNKDDETKHLTVKDMDGNDITAAATAVDEYLKMEKVQDIMKSQNDIQLTFQVQSYSESMHAVYKENTLYQVNYTSGEEAEGEAPGMTLVEDGESFTIPAENHHLYLDGQTLRYWIDEDGNKYDLGQSYTLGQTFTASKDLPSGIAKDDEFTVPKKDIFLTPVFKVNDFTVMNLSQTATAKWPLSRKGGATYDGNGDIVINFEGINGIYVTPLKLENGDFIDLKMDIRGENGKANNVNSSDRCQVNSGTVFGLPSSSNCTFTLNSANSSISAKIDGAAVEGQQSVSSNYTGDKTQIDVNFTGNTYLYEVVAQYNPVTTDLPELDYATVGNISLGALGTPLAGVKLSTLKSAGQVEHVPADLSNSTTGIMPVVRGTATRGGYVEVIQATIDNPVATMLVKTRDGVTVSVYKIGFDVTYPNIAPRVTDLKIDRKFQCDLKKMYEKAIEDTRVDGTNYLNDNAYLRHLGVDGETPEKAKLERVAINGVINIKFSTKMAETTIPAATFKANGTGKALGQAIYALEGQTLTFTYKGLDVNTEYDFIIPAGTFKDVFWAESTKENKPNHVYDEDIRIHFTTVENAISTDRRVINYVVTHNQASHFNADQAKMVADGEPVQVASNELIKNLEAARIPYGTLDRGVELANAYKESGKRFYIFVPDGEYQLMGNDFVKSVSSPIGEDGKTMTLGKTENVYSGITTVSRDNVSITGQSQEKTIVYNHPAFEGLSNASTLKLNGGIANFYAQDLTLQNRFDFLRCRRGGGTKGVAPALWDRSSKPIFKNVKFDSYQDTYYTNANNQFDDTRGYAEDCTIMGYVDFICGDGDDWFQNCNMVVRQGVGSTATNMFAPRQYDTQKWGYVMNKCTFSAENNTAFDVNNGKMTIARPWANSPAETLIECKYDVLSTDDGYKKMTGGGLILRMQEYKSYNSDGTILDLSKRSLRNSTPGIGSYDAVMTPSKAAEYNLFDVMGGEDGYDPTLYTAQVNMTSGIKQDDTFLTWDDQKEALCYFIFTSDTENGEYKLFAVTDKTEFEMGNAQINKWFCVRAANQRGGLGAPTDAFQYKAHESYKRALVNNNQVIDGWRWSTIYLDFDAKAPVVQHEKVDEYGATVLDTNGDPVMEDEIYVYALVKVDATKLTFKRVKIMEKNCGYLIKARPRPEEYEFKYTEKTPVYHHKDMTVPEYRTAQSLSAEVFPHMSLMNGSVVDVPAAGIAGYTLASKTSYGLGFYKYVGSTYNANYAWLDAALVAEAQKAMADGSLSSEAKAGFMLMVFDDDIIEEESGVATDLDGISNRHLDDDDAIYNLAGQRINPAQMQRGMIYIIGGKKIRY